VRILGTATVSEGMKIVLISRIAKKFNTKKGDIIVFYENDEGDIIIRKG
jgi:bifunctional DNA-binding transcriptional regulator/antitoxin component of YhaV-PrlF toxin-antitoxin module